MIEQWHKEKCKCCGGTGVQIQNDGIKILCPTCNGTGERNVSNIDNLPPGTYFCSERGALDVYKG